MADPIKVRGTIEMQSVHIFVRFADDSPAELIDRAKRVPLKRYQVGDPQTKGGEPGWFWVETSEHEITVVRTHLDDREPWDPSNEGAKPSGAQPAPASSSKKQSHPTPNSPAPSTEHSAGSVPSSQGDDRFIHSYNFVRIPSRESFKEALDNKFFKRVKSAPHDVYDANRKTGFIDCELTTRTYWFIPDPRKIKRDKKKHTSLGYFTLDDVPHRSWNADQAEKDTTPPAIPGSSLRGMVRSVFETATLSCFNVFDARRLDFRIGYSPDHQVAKPNDSSEVDYVPCQIVMHDEDSATVQLLDGRFEKGKGRSAPMMPAGLIRAYPNKVKRGNGMHPQWMNLNKAVGGTPVIAYLETREKQGNKPYRWRVAELPMAMMDRRQWEDFLQGNGPSVEELAATIQPKVESWLESHGGENDDRYLIFGFLHRTGPNWPEKKDERLFFDAVAPCNSRPSGSVRERIEQFLTDDGKRLVVPTTVLRECEEALRGYTRRSGKKLKPSFEVPPREIQPGENRALPSDFVLKKERDVKIEVGDLFYALIREENGSKEILGLYPVAIPRLSHEQSRGSLLPDELYPCGRRHEKCDRCSQMDSLPDDQRGKLCGACLESSQRLCPACRVFGWTRDLTHFHRRDREKLKGDPSRVDAIAGHVRFSHATLIDPWDDCPERQATKITLPILSSPSPTATGFYLRPREGWETQRSQRWPPVTGLDNEKNPVAKLPVYRSAEADLAGRKMYRRKKASADQLNHAAVKDQNQTVHALPDRLKFEFRVHFDNLDAEELGALLFSLNLSVPEDWKTAHGKLPADAQFDHALGHGKPAGMGRCSIKATGICINGADRYQSDGFDGVTSAEPTREIEAADMAPFFTAWAKLDRNSELVESRNDFLEMLLVGSEPTQYPPGLAWWKHAKTQGVRLPEPIGERTERDKRLPLAENQLREFAKRQRDQEDA